MLILKMKKLKTKASDSAGIRMLVSSCSLVWCPHSCCFFFFFLKTTSVISRGQEKAPLPLGAHMKYLEN
jgi:hypothetical protein